jgi:hypothetical protein
MRQAMMGKKKLQAAKPVGFDDDIFADAPLSYSDQVGHSTPFCMGHSTPFCMGHSTPFMGHSTPV